MRPKVSQSALSEADKLALGTLDPKLGLIRDRVRSVVTMLSSGLYIWGEGGIGKSYTVLDELQQRKANYVLHNSRMTGRGLVDGLEQRPTAIHVIEDCESMMDDKRAWGVLRSALWSQSKARPMQRLITWTAFEQRIQFIFTGGIILIANSGLADKPAIRALATRIPVLNLVVTDGEIAALMRQTALQGYAYGHDQLSPPECLQVAEYLIERMVGLKRPPDMRIFVNALRDKIQHASGESTSDWQDLVETGSGNAPSCGSGGPIPSNGRRLLLWRCPRCESHAANVSEYGKSARARASGPIGGDSPNQTGFVPERDDKLQKVSQVSAPIVLGVSSASLRLPR